LVTLRVPTPSANTITNVLGGLGLIAVVIAIGALTDWRWGMLAAGVFAVILCVLAQTTAAQRVEVSDLDAHRNRRAG
jgi:hypothetical protein